MGGLWERHTDTIVDVAFVNVDSASYRSSDPVKVLEGKERSKKRKYLHPCLEQRRHFTPFVVSCDGLIGREAATFLRKLASRLAKVWTQPYSHVAGFLRARMSIAIVREQHRCLRGPRSPSSRMSEKRPQWEDGAGLHLFQ